MCFLYLVLNSFSVSPINVPVVFLPLHVTVTDMSSKGRPIN